MNSNDNIEESSIGSAQTPIAFDKKFLDHEKMIINGRSSFVAKNAKGPNGEKLDLLVAEPYKSSFPRRAYQTGAMLMALGAASETGLLMNTSGNVPGTLYGANKKIEQHLPNQYLVEFYKPGENKPYKTEVIKLEKAFTPFAVDWGDKVKVLNTDRTLVKVGSIKMDLLVKGPDGKYATNPVPLAGAGPRAFSAEGLDTKVLSLGKNSEYTAAENGKIILESQKGYMFVLEKCPDLIQQPSFYIAMPGETKTVFVEQDCNPKNGSTLSVGPTYMEKIGVDAVFNKRLGKNFQLGVGGFYMPLGKDNIETLLKTDVVNIGYPAEFKTSHMTERDAYILGILANATFGQKGKLQVIGEAGVGKMMSRHNYAFKQTATNLDTGELIKELICANGSENFDKYVYRLGVGLQKMGDCDKFGLAVVGGVILGLPKEYLLNNNAVGVIPIELNKKDYKAYVGLRATF